MSISLIPQVKQYFWGDNLAELSWQEHKRYITQTLLEKGDVPAISWLLRQTSSVELKQLLPTIKLSRKSHNFWQIYLS